MATAAEEAGVRLAVLTSLVRLLEVKAFELEGPAGTGPLEDDIAVLEASAASGIPTAWILWWVWVKEEHAEEVWPALRDETCMHCSDTC